MEFWIAALQGASMSALPAIAYDLIALLLILLFAWGGYRKGLIKELASMLAIAASYFLARPLGERMLPSLGLENVPEFLATPIILTIGSIAGYVLVRFGCFLAIKFFWLDREWKKKWQHAFIHWGGFVYGSAFGVLIVFVLAWYFLWTGKIASTLVRSIEVQGTAEGENAGALIPARLMVAHGSGIAESVIGKIATRTNPFPEDFIEKIEEVTEAAANPEKMEELMENLPVDELMGNASVQELMENSEIQRMVEEKDFMGLLAHPKVKELLENPEIREMLEGMSF